MIVYELAGNTEAHPSYQKLEIENGARQHDFLQSIIDASLKLQRPMLSTQVIRALNYHAIACLHSHAGEFRPCDVEAGDYKPPQHYRVQFLMDDFVNFINRKWDALDSVELAAKALWRLNWIHPFINGNGRTSRAIAYFIICVKSRGLLPGPVILPELINRERERYVKCLKKADQTQDVRDLQALLSELLAEQLKRAQREPEFQEVI